MARLPMSNGKVLRSYVIASAAEGPAMFKRAHGRVNFRSLDGGVESINLVPIEKWQPGGYLWREAKEVKLSDVLESHDHRDRADRALARQRKLHQAVERSRKKSRRRSRPSSRKVRRAAKRRKSAR